MVKSIFSLGIFMVFAGLHTAKAQANETEQKAATEQAEVKKLVESKRYMFVAQTIMPQSGPTRALTSPYDLRVIQDTLSADLPYIGRDYVSSGYGNTDNALNFKTTGFVYEKKDGKNEGWDITITPKAVKNVRQISLRISSTGATYVVVSSNTRQTVSFNGYLRALD